MDQAHREFLSLLAYVYIQHRRPDRAAKLLAALAVLAPGDAGTLKSLALALVEDGRGEEAIEVLDRLDALGDGGPTSWLLRARALDLLGQETAARAAVENFIAARGAA